MLPGDRTEWTIEHRGFLDYVIKGPGVVMEFAWTLRGAKRVLRRKKRQFESGFDVVYRLAESESPSAESIDYPGLRGRHASGG